MTERVAIAILAAGRGSRLGTDTPKPLVPVADRPMLSWAIDAALESGLRPLVLVVGHRAAAVEEVAPAGVSVVRARGWRKGIASSLRAALVALEPWAQVGAVCIGLGDQPLIGAQAYARLVAAYDDGASLVAATYGGVRGNPVLLGRSLWDAARALDGDEGARALMRDHPVVDVACDGTGSPRDIDTLDDLREVEQLKRGA